MFVAVLKLFVMRTDYTVRAIDQYSGDELWNVTMSEFGSDVSEDSGTVASRHK